jgi:hypothetical protein
MQDEDRTRCERIVVICPAFGEDLAPLWSARDWCWLSSAMAPTTSPTRSAPVLGAAAFAHTTALRAHNCAAARDYRAKSQATVLS